MTGRTYGVVTTALSNRDFDQVVRARMVDHRAGRDHDAAALDEEPALSSGRERALEERVHVRTLRDQKRCDPPLERHLPQGVVVVGEADDRAARPEPRDRRG